jgi:hypothetical protein
VYVTPRLPLGYVYTLFYLRYPPARFQREVQVSIDTTEGAYQVNQFGRYVFSRQRVATGKPYGYLLYKGEPVPVGPGRKTILFSDETWEVGTVLPTTNNLGATGK